MGRRTDPRPGDRWRSRTRCPFESASSAGGGQSEGRGGGGGGVGGPEAAMSCPLVGSSRAADRRGGGGRGLPSDMPIAAAAPAQLGVKAREKTIARSLFASGRGGWSGSRRAAPTPGDRRATMAIARRPHPSKASADAPTMNNDSWPRGGLLVGTASRPTGRVRERGPSRSSTFGGGKARRSVDREFGGCSRHRERCPSDRGEIMGGRWMRVRVGGEGGEGAYGGEGTRGGGVGVGEGGRVVRGVPVRRKWSAVSVIAWSTPPAPDHLLTSTLAESGKPWGGVVTPWSLAPRPRRGPPPTRRLRALARVEPRRHWVDSERAGGGPSGNSRGATVDAIGRRPSCRDRSWKPSSGGGGGGVRWPPWPAYPVASRR